MGAASLRAVRVCRSSGAAAARRSGAAGAGIGTHGRGRAHRGRRRAGRRHGGHRALAAGRAGAELAQEHALQVGRTLIAVRRQRDVARIVDRLYQIRGDNDHQFGLAATKAVGPEQRAQDRDVAQARRRSIELLWLFCRSPPITMLWPDPKLQRRFGPRVVRAGMVVPLICTAPSR
jgi:hypothetical protein